MNIIPAHVIEDILEDNTPDNPLNEMMSVPSAIEGKSSDIAEFLRVVQTVIDKHS